MVAVMHFPIPMTLMKAEVCVPLLRAAALPDARIILSRASLTSQEARSVYTFRIFIVQRTKDDATRECDRGPTM